jgi:hypothetical protein
MEARDRWREHVEQWKASGLTAAQYDDRAGVNPGTLSYWNRRLGREARASRRRRPWRRSWRFGRRPADRVVTR